ncbi:adenosine deaminase [Terriglobus roseus DSM 18391]|uniref:Adenosine deaminase n=1 Tax=Terriglobus roseus (strain DSM 18391 / NRRL B-41598 / KBS 63) TaxID=926566 RepID=I3ZD03_TERRK|nr:adenosine deaminase [Terriglobus roseus]AFL87121.1 adenosine deaminase [Terriglobus roseus DSM 18391]
MKQMTITPREWLRGLPKCELHLHLEGTIVPETLVKLSQRHDAEPLTLEAARALYVYDNFLGFLMAFKAVSERLQTPEDYELITYEMIHRLSEQGVRHAEVYISYGIILRFKTQLTVEDVTAAIERGRVRGEQDFGTTVIWLIDAVRHFGVEEAAIVFTKAAELSKIYPSIVGIGIGGDEARGPAQDFKGIYEEAKAAGLHLTAHAGENVSAQSIWAAINIGAERIGHALSAVDDPELLDILAEKQIPLELNVTSNLRTGCCSSMEAHPVRHYFERGLMITLNSDDPPMFGADLLDEYETVHREFEFTFEQMREIAGNSVEASFLPPMQKLKLLAEVEQYR